MLRSGTSLLQTILTNHPDLFVAYQPFHQLYVEAKQIFLDAHGIKRPLPLGDGTGISADEPHRFLNWLRQTSFYGELAERLVRRSVTGKGGSCARMADVLPLAEGHFIDLQSKLHDAVALHYGKSNARWHGSKEILCEEYLPYLIEHDTRCLLIVRDPRAVVASASRGRYREAVGDSYPVLMLARIWRKSIAYALVLGMSENLRVIRYEDLVLSTATTLERIADFLNVNSFAPGSMKHPLFDHAGDPWLGNSSFGEKMEIDARSTFTWSAHLPDSVANLIEALCYPEMLAMGYKPRLAPSDCADVIQSTLEDTSGVRASYLDSYALNQAERQRELARWTAISTRNSSNEAHGLSVLDGVEDKLVGAVRSIVNADG